MSRKQETGRIISLPITDKIINDHRVKIQKNDVFLLSGCIYITDCLSTTFAFSIFSE